MSVQFEPPPGLNAAHLGAFWFTEKAAFPKVRAVEPIVTPPEEFGSEGQWLPPALQLAFTNEPNCRLQMSSGDDQWMCQIQRDRIVINWRKHSEEYPRYSATLDRFHQAWRSWQDALAAMSIGRVTPRQWELTYVNRIAQGDLWSSPNDWPRVLPGIWAGDFAASPNLDLQGLQGRWVWQSSTDRARLYIEPKPGRSIGKPPIDLLILSLTARGPVESAESTEANSATPIQYADMMASIEDGMNIGHALIVSTFDAICSDSAKQQWKRRASSE